MFWSVPSYSQASPLEGILDKQKFTLEELLDEEDLIQVRRRIFCLNQPIYILLSLLTLVTSMVCAISFIPQVRQCAALVCTDGCQIAPSTALYLTSVGYSSDFFARLPADSAGMQGAERAPAEVLAATINH